MNWWNRNKSAPAENQNENSDAPEDEVTLPPGTSTDDDPEATDAAPEGAKNTMTNTTPGNGTGESVQTPAAQQEHPVLSAALAAGIDTPEKLSALQISASAYDSLIGTRRTEAKDRATALFAGNEAELTAEIAIIDALPAGVALDHHIAKLNASYDAKFGTTASGGAVRKSAPNALPALRVAGDAANNIPASREPTEQEKQKAEQETLATY